MPRQENAFQRGSLMMEEVDDMRLPKKDLDVVAARPIKKKEGKTTWLRLHHSGFARD